MKHLDPNDPRFTAKALGETETQPINPEAADDFAALRSFSQTLKSELKARDAKESLTAEQKEEIRAAVQPTRKKMLPFPLWVNTLAACLGIGLVGILSFKVLDTSQDILHSEEGPVATDTDKAVADSGPSVESLSPAAIEGETRELDRKRSDSARTTDQSAKPGGVADSNQTREQEEVFELSPFSVTKTEPQSQAAGASVANDRVGIELRDLAASQDVATQAYRSSPAERPAPPIRQTREVFNREAYDRIVENAFKTPIDHPLSTFSIDVDTASYANVRRYLNSGSLPPADAVRIEEMINYFPYDLEGPDDDTPFAVHVESANAPWNGDHLLVRIALQGEKVDLSDRPDANLVFLIDVSGSMGDPNKLPLVQRSLNLLVDQMEARDRIAVVVYAGASGLALPSTTANNKETIQHAIGNLRSGGSTNGGAGIELAYSVAQKHFLDDGINRVILCTDGDFNVGTTNRGSLTRLIEEKAKTGVFFSVLGFGMGNYQDASMEELSNKGNGNYGYVDSFREARKVFVDDMLGTLHTIAKDVKIQVEFNPGHVASYRLIGYENRMLAKEDFNDDTKDAGEIGAGHRVTALYEIVPAGLSEGVTPGVDALKYQTAAQPVAKSDEMLTVKLRYKQPNEDESQLIEKPFIDSKAGLQAASDDFRFATAVAAFGMLLRNSEYTAEMSLEDVLTMAGQAKGNDAGGLRSEFIELVEKAIALKPPEAKPAITPQPRE